MQIPVRVVSPKTWTFVLSSDTVVSRRLFFVLNNIRCLFLIGQRYVCHILLNLSSLRADPDRSE